MLRSPACRLLIGRDGEEIIGMLTARVVPHPDRSAAPGSKMLLSMKARVVKVSAERSAASQSVSHRRTAADS